MTVIQFEKLPDILVVVQLLSDENSYVMAGYLLLRRHVLISLELMLDMLEVLKQQKPSN